MGRSKRTQPVINKQLDLQDLERILRSNKNREVKLREISQLNNGNRKIGTLQAKNIYENYLRQQNKTLNIEDMINRLDPNTKKMFNDIKGKMDPQQFQGFLTNIYDKLKEPEELEKFLSSNFKDTVGEVQQEAEILKKEIRDGAGPSDPLPEEEPVEEINMDEPVHPEMIMDMDGNVVDETTDIKDSDLPTLSKDEYNFLSNMMKKK